MSSSSSLVCLSVCLFVVSCFFFSLCSSCLAQEAYPRKIGVVAALTGSFAPSGTTVKNSVELAQSESLKEVKFIFEDDSFEPKNSISAVRKLIEVDHVDGLIVWGTPTGLAVNEIAEKAKIPLIVFSMVGKVVDGKKYVMKHWLPSDAVNSGVIGEIQKRKIKTVSIVVLTNDAMLKLRDSFIESNATKILSSVEYPKTESDFKIDALKIKALNPDAVYLLVWTPQLSLFAKQLRAVGYKGILFGTQNLEDKNELHNSEGTLEGAWFLGTDDTKASKYNQRYQDKFRSDPVAGGSNAYDVAKIFISCSTSKELNSCLHSIKDFHGALGTYSATDRNDFNLKPLLKCIRNGEIAVNGC